MVDCRTNDGRDVPLVLTKLVWVTAGNGPEPLKPLTEAERARNYTVLANELPRTNANIMAMFPYNWVDYGNPGDGWPYSWAGIAGRESGTLNGEPVRLRPAGEAYRSQIALFRGHTTRPIPRTTVMLAPGRPVPDNDRDGIPDEMDDHPLSTKSP